MAIQSILEKAAQRLKGFKFEPGIPPFDEPDDIYAALVGSTEDEIPVIEARDLLETSITKLIRICLKYEDVYRRLRGHEAFCDISHLVSRFVGARRRYLANPDEDSDSSSDDSHEDEDDDDGYYKEDDNPKVTYLTKVLDQYISTVDSVSTARPTRGVRTLTAPRDTDIAQRLRGTRLGAVVWPPGHYVDVDVAIMSEETIRRELFGISTRNKAFQEAPRFPHDQDPPLAVRKYLSWLSLTKKNSDSHCALFLAPVAFIDHGERQDWYEHTGHQARFYATIHEFLDYAHDEFEKTSMDYKTHAICLLTPWFFDVDTFAKTASEDGKVVVPNVWEKTCFRAGMMLSLSKVELEDQRWHYRLVLFKPGPPTYPMAAQLSERRAMENDWVVDMLDCVDKRFQVVQGWTDGTAEFHEEPPSGRRVGADSVEASCEIIEEIMVDISQLPTTEKRFLARGFTTLARY
ncbi:hypothetical protein F4810DRAFT_720412 [Camillea tinctor]|nr:hypothetical protein F4810DRAFT_720412 [Camillea tinctor]